MRSTGYLTTNCCLWFKPQPQRSLSLPLVYDVHHHRCDRDGLSVAEATALAAESWRALAREPYCHLSSPRNGWQGSDTKPHADYIDPADFPDCWQGRDMTVDVEAKAKEMAVVRLMADLRRAGGI
jgi:UV DNA damage endonuclease